MKTAVRSIPPQTSETRTARLDVAAFLLLRGFEISDVNLDCSTATFSFKDPNLNGDTAVKDFYNGAQVPVMNMPTLRSASAVSGGEAMR
jgi:hypothetical protein